MVWATTIATFLGTVITALLLYFVFSRRERILKMLKEQRAERRIAAEVSLGLASLDEPLSYERSSRKTPVVTVPALSPRSPGDPTTTY